MATITTFKTNALPTKTVGTLQLQSKIPTATQTKPVITTVARPVVSQQAATEENVKLDIIKQTSKPASSLISWVPEKQETAVQTPTTATQPLQQEQIFNEVQNEQAQEQQPPVEQVAEQTAPATDDKKKKIIFIIIAVIAIWLLFFKKD